MKKFYLYKSDTYTSYNKHLVQLPDIAHKKIIALAPHADDIAIGCGGTIALLSKTNDIFPLLFFTGERGVDAPDKAVRIKTREQEMIRESEMLGLQRPVFLKLSSYDDISVSTITRDIARIKQLLCDIRPEIIFLPHEGDAQPRHNLATDMALRAIKRAHMSVELFFYETSWHPFGPLDFNVGVILDDAVMARKIAAVRVHASQLKRTRFDIAAENLARFRAVTVPEQHIQGYGHMLNYQFDYLEVFLKKSINVQA
jgi:LmbE family N-acetylglucosaminyl deacetylase